MKKLNRTEMMKWMTKKGLWCKTTEEFNPNSKDGIWTSGEDDKEISGLPAYSYYAQSKSYELGVLIHWEEMLNKRGWYSEWYDCGTVMIWENNQ